MTRGLTDKQQEVLTFIGKYLDSHGYPPTVREIAAGFGFRSPRAAHDHLKALERKGFLRSAPGKPRALEILKRKKTGLPILGVIAAGQPCLAVEEAEEYVDLDPSFFADGNLFVLRVQGDSMIGDHISEGDLVVVRPQSEALNNQIVAVLINDEVTLKHFYRQADGLELKSSNPAVPPILVPASEDVKILGVMVGLVRRMYP